jgi:hypothetical protein
LAITTNASVCDPRHYAQRRVGRRGGQGEFQQADGFPALGDWRSHQEPVVAFFDQYVLATQCLLLGAAVEGQHHRDVLVLPAAVRHGTDRHV